jgi:hypothetical protein
MAISFRAKLGLGLFYQIRPTSSKPAISGECGMGGLDIDLAAVAGMAGLGGSAIAGIGAAIFFKGLIMRIVAQLVVTTALSFIGFIALFNFLGFQIIPPKEIAGVQIPGSTNFAPSSVPTEAAPAEGAYIKSPWRK